MSQRFSVLFCMLVLAGSCAQVSKLRSALGGVAKVDIALSEEKPAAKMYMKVANFEVRNAGGERRKERTVMKLTRGENGELSVADTIQAAVTVSTFRNVAERHGVVELKFDIVAPSSIIDSEWQLRFSPQMAVGRDTVSLPPVYITGKKFRDEQEKGYGRYGRFVGRIVTDSSAFVSGRELEIFLSRYGTDYAEALDHYTDKEARRRNESRISRKDEMFHRYVVNPYPSGEMKLDTVVTADREVRYTYSRTVTVREGVRKAEIFLKVGLRSVSGKEYALTGAGPLCYYISSFGTLADLSLKKDDSTYESGLSALKDHRFREALPLLVPYSDYNTALAYLALDYNDRAEEILLVCPRSAKVLYLLAILRSRRGDIPQAESYYAEACRLDRTFIYRGNLDPEISRFKKNQY